MFHCHNLIHEDHDMMAALNVTALKDLGYDEKTSFIDPMDTKYRAKSFKPEDLTNRGGDFDYDAIEKKCKDFQDMDAYKKVNEVEEKLEEYWKTRSTQTTLKTVASSSGGGSASVSASQSASGSGSSVASATGVSSTSGASSTSGSTLVTSASSAKTSSSTKTTSSDDKGGKKATSSSTTKASSTKK
jgi:bilirubin oxidase